jgi:esterase/lipase superfamily enzyme
LGPEHPIVAQCLEALGRALQAAHRPGDALERLTRSVAIRQRFFGPEHPIVAESMVEFGRALLATRQPVDALRVLTKALSIQEQSLGQEQPAVAYSLLELARALQATNRSAEAVSLLERVVSIDEGAREPERLLSLPEDEEPKPPRPPAEPVRSTGSAPDRPAALFPLIERVRTLTERLMNIQLGDGPAEDASPDQRQWIPPSPGAYPEPLPDPYLVSVLFATNRVGDGPARSSNVETFSAERSDELTFGCAVVKVPKTHRLGAVERPRQFTFLGITLAEAEREQDHLILSGQTMLTRENFVAALKDNPASSCLMFVHGFNTGFQEAIFRLAQIAFDTQFQGVSVAFSWPSKGRIMDYDYDRESALFSRQAFLEVLSVLHADPGISNIYFIAHSLGNHIVVEALDQARSARTSLPLTEVVLAAPDVDRQVFEQTSSRLKEMARSITLYASSADRALLVSQAKARGLRAGYVSPAEGPVVLPGIETIDVTAVGDDMFALNHDAYPSTRSVIDDIGRLVTSSIHPPHLRSPQIRRVPEGSPAPRYWKFPN